MKFDASRDRARVNALEAVTGFKKAVHPCLKGFEIVKTLAVLEEDRRNGESLFDPNASLQLRADEWNRIWQRDKAEQPRLYQALHACRAEAAKAEHARPPISEGALARAVALLRNKKRGRH